MEVLEKLKKLEEERDALLKQERDKLIEQIEELIGKLTKLNFSYALVERDKARKRMRKTRECKICGFVTEPVHDTRRHAGEDKEKPFTPKRLAELGLRKITN
jgi:hypothetical protein